MRLRRIYIAIKTRFNVKRIMMRSFFTAKPGKYLSRIYLWVATAIVVIVSIFSAIVYYNVDKMVMQNEYKTNRKILNQVRYNIEYMDDMIKNLCLATYLNSDTISMMFGENLSYDELAMKINKIRTSIVDVNPYIDSIYIYNNRVKAYFTTNNGLFYTEKALDDMFTQYGSGLPKMKPILHSIPYTVPGSTVPGKKLLLTYFIYDGFDAKNMPEGAVIVNVKSEWLINSISAINAIGGDDLSETADEAVFVFDQNGQYFEGNDGKPKEQNQDNEALKAAIRERLLSDRANPNPSTDPSVTINTLTMDSNGEKYFVSYINIDKIGWTLVKTQAFDQTYKYINQLRTSIVLITMFFILLALILAVTVSRSIYKPVGNLIRQITGNKGYSYDGANPSRPKDEISYLSHVYERSMEQLNTFQSEKGNNRNILRTYLLRKLLVDSHTTTKEELEKFAAEYGMTIDFSKRFAVCVIRMGSSDSINYINASDMELFQFAIINISMEVFSKYYGNEGIDIREDHVVILINPTDLSDVFFQKMKEVMKEVQGHIFKHFQLPVSMTISEIGDNFDDITKLYNAALGNAMYSYVGGNMSIILPSDYAENALNTHMSFSATLERKLSEGIKSGNPEQIDSAFKRILEEIAKLKYKNMMLSVMHLVNIISDTVEEMNKTRVEPVFIDYNMFQKILDMCTLQELYDGSMEIFRQIISRADSVENRKHIFLVEAIKEIINANYQNPGLCLQQVADTVKMSQVYVGKIFKSITQLSVAEYLNEVRLMRASELLCIGNQSINEIVQNIGMENESYFYKLFKARYGVTPREYCLNKAVKKQ